MTTPPVQPPTPASARSRPTEATLPGGSAKHRGRAAADGGPDDDVRGRAALRALGVDDGTTLSEGSGGAIDVVSPLTGSLIGRVPRLEADDVARAVRRSRTAQSRWRRAPMRRRARVLLALHDLIWRLRAPLLDLVQWESGKARTHAFEELADTAITARYYARTGARHLAAERRRGAVPGLTRTTVHHRPLGVVGIISPWNYPLTLAASDAVAALMAGNAVVLKPDSATPFTALAVHSLLRRAGADPDLLQVVTGPGAALGESLIDAVDALMFTGSSATGSAVASRAGARLIPVSAELGGKNPLIVRADAPVARTVRGTVGACFSNAGQLCVSIERVYVHEAVWDRFVPAFVRATRALRVGAAMGWGADMGPLISPEHLAKVAAHVSDAVAKGATVLTGGRALPELSPTAYAPTLLTGVTEDMDLHAAETFGPVACLYRVSGDEQAVRLANASPYGLNASVWTADRHAGAELAGRIRAGTVNVNEGYAAAWGSTAAPMGGMGASGLGRRHGVEGIVKYTQSQTVAVQHLAPLHAPPGADGERWASGMAAWLRLARHLPRLDR